MTLAYYRYERSLQSGRKYLQSGRKYSPVILISKLKCQVWLIVMNLSDLVKD